jgi:hypothetical protein
MAIILKNDEYPEDLLYDMYDPYNYYRSQKLMDANILLQVVTIIKRLTRRTRNIIFLNLNHIFENILKLKRSPINGLHNIMNHLMVFLILANYRAHDKIFVATGFGGNGMPYSTVAHYY